MNETGDLPLFLFPGILLFPCSKDALQQIPLVFCRHGQPLDDSDHGIRMEFCRCFFQVFPDFAGQVHNQLHRKLLSVYCMRETDEMFFCGIGFHTIFRRVLLKFRLRRKR